MSSSNGKSRKRKSNFEETKRKKREVRSKQLSKPTATIAKPPTSPPQVSSQSKKGGEIFQVERILGDRGANRTKEYLIKWKGFSDAHNTWEAERNILDPIFLKKYQCRKYIGILETTAEALKPDSVTVRTIRALRKGLATLDSNPPPLKATSRTCPVCLRVIHDFRKFGGHVRSHMQDPNYEELKEVSKIIPHDWYS